MVVVLLALTIAGAWSGVLSFMSWSRGTKIKRLHTLVLLASLAGFAVCAVWGVWGAIASDSLAFDSAVWQSRSGTLETDDFLLRRVTLRQKMVDDLVAHVLPGRTRAEIEALLGPLKTPTLFKDSNPDLVYYLGPDSPFFPVDAEWLLIWFDRSGRFERCAIAAN